MSKTIYIGVEALVKLAAGGTVKADTTSTAFNGSNVLKAGYNQRLRKFFVEVDSPEFQIIRLPQEVNIA